MKKLTALLLLSIYSAATFACSTFLLNKDGQLIFGRNYDWVSGNGMLVVNARGVKKSSLVQPGEKAANWVSQCGSITFNQFGKEFPHGGMNEKGLVIELMWLSETDYPQPDDRAALNELQWIQYQLDNHTTVDEVIASDRNIRISPAGAAPLHFLVADAYGNAATIEFIRGKMVVHQGKDLPVPVLTNTVYETAARSVNEAQNASATFGDNSVDRFATACRMVQQFQNVGTKENAVDYAFGILDKVAQGSYTKWRVVYDISKRQIHFVTAGSRKTVSFDKFDFNCNTTALYLDVNDAKPGAATALFAPLSFEKNKAMLKRSALESSSQISIPEQNLEGAAAYFRQVQCAK